MFKSYLKITLRWTWYFIASFIILLAMLGVLLQSLTPVINHHKKMVEEHLSHLLHWTVHIERIEATWVRFGPEIHLTGIDFINEEEGGFSSFFHANDLSIQIGLFRSILHQSPYFNLIKISGASVDMREIAPNQYEINHEIQINLSDQSPSHFPAFFNWLIHQNTIELSQVNFDIHQLQNHHAHFNLDQANIYQFKQGDEKQRLAIFLNGFALVDSDQSIFKKLQAKISLYSWIDLVQGKIKVWESELLSEDLSLQKGEDDKHYPGFKGVFLWQPLPEKMNQWRLEGKNITLLKSNAVSEKHSFELWHLDHHYVTHINQLNLANMAYISDFFDIFSEKLEIKKMELKGEIENVNIEIPEDLSKIGEYRFSADFYNMSSQAYQSFPMIHHLSGLISGSPKEAEFTFFDQNDEIDFPVYFDKPISLKNIWINGRWKESENESLLALNSIYISSPDLMARGQMTLKIPMQSSPFLSLFGQYHLKNTAALKHLLPMKIFNQDFSLWLNQAIKKGEGSDGSVLIRGTIDDFPYGNEQGLFVVDSSIKSSSIAFSPDWPLIEQVAGNLLLHNQDFNLSVHGKTGSLDITEAEVHISNYKADHVVLEVHAKSASEIKNYLNYIEMSPLKQSLGQWLKPFSLMGQGQLVLHINLPLDQMDMDHIAIAGQWIFKNTDFTWNALKTSLKQASGLINFTQNTLQADNISAQLGDESIKINISSQKEKQMMKAIDLYAHGLFSPEQIKNIFHIDGLSSYLSGKSIYDMHAHIPIQESKYTLDFNSSLQGLLIKLPAPFGKEEKERLPFSLQMSFDPDHDWMNFMIDYAKNTHAVIILEHYFKEDQQNKPSIKINAHTNYITWPFHIDAGFSNQKSVSPWWKDLSSLELHIDHALLYDYSFSSLALFSTQKEGLIYSKISAKEGQGNIIFSMDMNSPIQANFDYLSLVSKSKKTSPSTLNAKTAATWPQFFLKIKAFKINEYVLGNINLHTSPINQGLLFNNIEIKNNIYQFATHGQWVATSFDKDKSSFEGELNINDTGKFLQMMNISKNFHAKAGKVKYQLLWPGSPMNFQLKTLEGKVDIEVKDGLIPVDGDAAKMGLGKVLTLFSTQSIQRRLKLNFSDLGQKGYSFNSLISELYFNFGQAQVKKGEFDGPEAKINFEGPIDLINHAYHLNLIVTPYVTSSLPLIATLAGGPIAGVATYAFDKIAENGIAKLTSYHYLLIGPWSQPKLIDLDAEKKEKEAAIQAKLDERNVAPVEEL